MRRPESTSQNLQARAALTISIGGEPHGYADDLLELSASKHRTKDDRVLQHNGKERLP